MTEIIGNRISPVQFLTLLACFHLAFFNTVITMLHVRHRRILDSNGAVSLCWLLAILDSTYARFVYDTRHPPGIVWLLKFNVNVELSKGWEN